jgi:hypothetical protein
MYLIKPKTAEIVNAEILGFEKADLKLLKSKKRYFFDWKYEQEQGRELYKLQLEGNKDILGVISLTNFESEQRIEINLLAVAFENVGKYKVFDRIAGCLIAFAAEKAMELYGLAACINLIPKTALAEYYMSKYGFMNSGLSLFADYEPICNLISLKNPPPMAVVMF